MRLRDGAQRMILWQQNKAPKRRLIERIAAQILDIPLLHLELSFCGEKDALFPKGIASIKGRTTQCRKWEATSLNVC
jgi:hypothetical protein